MLHACSIAILLFALLVTSHPTGFVTRANGTSARDVNAPDFYARILPLGASIVYGVGSSDGNGYVPLLLFSATPSIWLPLTLPSMTSFRKPLRDALRQAGWKVNMVGNRANGTMSDNSVEARSGDRVDQIHEAAKTSFKYQPNIVLINGGTNDCDQDYDVDHVGERMDALLDDIFREIPGTTVILSTVIPSTKDSIASRRDRANNQYRSLVYNRRRILNQKIVLADMDSPGTTFLTTADLTGDGIHPTDGGHLKMAAIFLRAINEARGAGFVTPPNESAAASDDGAGGNTCNKVYGVARGPVNTQAGSGLDDGIYVHNSASRGVRMTVTRPNETAFWFAHISSPEFDDLSDLIEYGDPDPNMGGRWYTRFNALGAGQWNVAYPMQIWIPDGCIARGVRWADVNGQLIIFRVGDGVDDFLCISPNGDVYASVAQVSAIGDIGWGASPSLWKPNVGLPQARVRIADIDGDGRADYCVVADNGDISCWRNGGQGPMPDYWQPLGVVFTGKGMGDVNGVRFYDINGDGRDDWLWLNDKGETWTYTNNRGCAKGQEGQGLTPLWRAGENSVGGAGSTHHGLDIPDVRDQIYFAKAYGEGVVFGQLPRADYVRIEPVAGSGGQIEYRFHVWQNLGGGATKLKADGDRYCNMMGHANGAQDYVWIHSTGYMRIYESRGGSFPSEPPYWGPNYIIFDPPATMGRQINRRDLHLADWDGDGLCDIIYVDPIFFDMEVWINKYRENNDFSSWEHWTEGAELPILPARCTEERGKGVFDNPVRFADIDGNGLADFLCMEPDGRTWGLLNSNGGKTLTKLSQIKKTEGKDRANLHFADVNGDGLDDFLWINKFNGDTEVWYNRGPIPASGSAFTWEHQGALYQGAAQGSCIRYPDLDGNGRADMHVVDSLANTAVTWFNDCGNGGGDDTNTLTTPTLQPGPEVSEDVEGLMAAIHDSEYEGTISNDDVVSLATMLIGYTECDWSQRREVRSGWLQSWKLMDHVRPKVSNLDFNSAAAIEYLGPPAINQPYQYRIKGGHSGVGLITLPSAWDGGPLS
ncbi:killer toxin subunits alpha beta [Staphylotrichum tortipilum]|uniref:Killer toxin subunits alpha beta n=1 Tax=Staphylotrichum tortipilum TaxID=2831512 RepID=A0AAN6MCK2_9PEZI|nr:killer toxin subunits alpha beta [Staphylotrichum longicolle]